MLVPTATQLYNLIAVDPDDELFGPFQANDPNVELIQCRYCCLVPNAYVPLVIDRPHSPKELWMTLKGAIFNNGLEQECEPLINYLTACISQPNPNDLSHLALEADELPTVVALDPDLIAHCQHIIHEDFHHFNNTVGHAQATLVQNGNQLARAKKGDRIRVLYQYLELAKQQLQLTYVKVDATPGLLEKVFNLQLHLSGADFKEYFNSFLLDTSNSSVVQQATFHKTLYWGGALPSAADLQSGYQGIYD
ncbi:predicted protein [Chaetoceros tenuissimus]|uniref:Uncharacterized protein n=1 Tax=Chaetoceros tenuissimus TaxID=426638 RepID=A0AAD3DGC2_9STRA|nr:predicted protein [Chaetoceros tenuissimus]